LYRCQKQKIYLESYKVKIDVRCSNWRISRKFSNSNKHLGCASEKLSVSVVSLSSQIETRKNGICGSFEPKECFAYS